jgi:hypothetical protein
MFAKSLLHRYAWSLEPTSKPGVSYPYAIPEVSESGLEGG